ncbi:MAG: hypothetical protein F6K11_02720 [Leptolyngbya sp. SIO3F4]|nr:hypothetical protein [Leptolyngbya sp. SIO3F4]
MRIFHNALDGPLSSRKLLGIVVYCILGAISVWATSESLNSSFEIPLLIAYIIGAAFVLTMALLVGTLKSFAEERRVGALRLIFVSIVFLFVWVLSLSTNTHKLFLQLKLEDVRKNELNDAVIALETIEKNQETVGNQVIQDYNRYVSSRIIDYKEEVKNPANCGHGPVADSLMTRVQKSMPGFSMSTPSGRQKNQASCRQLADEMSNRMFNELQKRVTILKGTLTEIKDCNKPQERRQTLESLKNNNSYLSDLTGLEVKQSLSDAHEYYNRLYECYNTGLLKNMDRVKKFTETKSFKKTLELPVPSFRLEKISYLIPYVRNYPRNNTGQYMDSLILSMAIALILDLSSFIILYYIILKKD